MPLGGIGKTIIEAMNESYGAHRGKYGSDYGYGGAGYFNSN